MEDAKTVVRELLTQVIEERGLKGSMEIKELSSGGANFTSALFAVSVDELKLFAKVAIVGEKMRAVMNADVLFKTEQIVYSDIAKVYNELLAKDALSFHFPKVYATLSDYGKESVIMEDLSAQDYKPPSRRDPIDWRFASAAINKLAIFHALSFAYEKKYPKEFSNMAVKLKYIPQDHQLNNEVTKTAWEKMVSGAVDVVKDDYKSALVNLLSDFTLFNKFRSPLNRTVLIHGDYRPSNLLIREQDGSLDIIVVDYQTVHTGSPVSDLLYFIFLGTDQQFRRNHYEELLELYHRELGTALAALGLDVEVEYPKEMYQKEVKEMLGPVLLMIVAVLPLVLADEASAPQVAGDADFEGFAMEPSAMFAERFAAIVEDCFRWGAL